MLSLIYNALIVSSFLVVFLPLCTVIDNHVSCHIFLVSSRVFFNFYLLNRNKNSYAKRQKDKSKKRKQESKEHIVDEFLDLI